LSNTRRYARSTLTRAGRVRAQNTRREACFELLESSQHG